MDLQYHKSNIKDKDWVYMLAVYKLPQFTSILQTTILLLGTKFRRYVSTECSRQNVPYEYFVQYGFFKETGWFLILGGHGVTVLLIL